uniref:Uncharacterized protein n=1 Tax=Arundo donax TaxID=35708 RepID=A0A0A9DJ26_ARUDO
MGSSASTVPCHLLCSLHIGFWWFRCQLSRDSFGAELTFTNRQVSRLHPQLSTHQPYTLLG